MGEEVFIITIVAMAMVTGIVMQWMKRGRGKSGGLNIDKLMNDLGLEDSDDIAVYKKKIVDLEQRVQVLEKLATAKKHTLADEIDRL